MFTPILYLFYPLRCLSCELPLECSEKHICTLCRHQLPEIDLQEKKQISKEALFGVFSSLISFSPLFSFEKESEIQQIIHKLKYQNYQKIGLIIGDWHGIKLAKDPNFNSVDIVIPVPIHYSKLRKRGYNQIHWYAKRLAHHLNAIYDNETIRKTKATKTQSKFNRQQRFNNILNSMLLINSETLKNKHVLIVDDVITTGATMRACLSCFNEIEGIKISIASIAVVHF